MEKELARRGIPYSAQQELELSFKGEILEQTYMPDLICYGRIVVELKAVTEVIGEHRAQILNYLKASRLKVGLLANFGCYPKAKVERFVL